MGALGRRAQGGEQMVVGLGIVVQHPAAERAVDWGVYPDPGAGVALVGPHRQAAGGMRMERGQRQIPDGGQVVDRAGPHRRDPQREATGSAST